jgi:urease accessory protein
MDDARTAEPVLEDALARRGRVELVATRAPDGRTYLSRQYASYPYHICRPQIVEGDPAGMMTLYLQSCAGGMFEHDRLAESVRVEARAAMHLTTQASTIVHSMTEGIASQTVELSVGSGGCLEYLPDPFILFPAARFENRIRLALEPDATAIVGEAFLSHDPRGGKALYRGYASEVRVERGGELLLLDRMAIENPSEPVPGAGERYRAHGSLFILGMPGAEAEILGAVRTALAGVAGVYAGASALPRAAGFSVRILAEDAWALRQATLAVWSCARLAATGRSPHPRRK